METREGSVGVSIPNRDTESDTGAPNGNLAGAKRKAIPAKVKDDETGQHGSTGEPKDQGQNFNLDTLPTPGPASKKQRKKGPEKPHNAFLAHFELPKQVKPPVKVKPINPVFLSFHVSQEYVGSFYSYFPELANCLSDINHVTNNFFEYDFLGKETMSFIPTENLPSSLYYNVTQPADKLGQQTQTPKPRPYSYSQNYGARPLYQHPSVPRYPTQNHQHGPPPRWPQHPNGEGYPNGESYHPNIEGYPPPHSYYPPNPHAHPAMPSNNHPHGHPGISPNNSPRGPPPNRQYSPRMGIPVQSYTQSHSTIAESQTPTSPKPNQTQIQTQAPRTAANILESKHLPSFRSLLSQIPAKDTDGPNTNGLDKT